MFSSTGQCDKIMLQPRDLFRLAKLGVNLVEIAADAHKNPPRAYWRQVIVAQTVIPALEVLDAIGLGQQLSAVEGIDVHLHGTRLIAADEMTGQADADHRQTQSSRDQ